MDEKTLSVIEVIPIDIGKGAGITRYLEGLNHALLSREKMQIHMVYPVQGECTVNEEKVGKGTIIHHRINEMPNSLSSPFSLLNKIKQISTTIEGIAQKEHIHVIHIHPAFAPIWVIASWLASRKQGIPCVATAHGVLLTRPTVGILSYCIVNLLVARGLYITGVSKASLRGISGAKTVIGSGIDVTFFNQQNVSEEDIREFKTHHGLSDYPLIFYPARIFKKKGQMDLLRITKKILEDGLLVQTLLMGNARDKKYTDSLYAEILRLKLQDYIKIVPFGSPEKVCIGYAASSMVVFPSYDEALGLVALEAAAMERPVVAYNAGGLCEAIIHGGNGYIANKGDVDAMRQYVKELLQNDGLRFNMGENGREFIKSHYNNMILADKHIKLYRELVSKNQV